MTKLTPMLRQYHKIKAKYADCILFFRLGDFYEMFFDDALEASKILDIVLTGRGKNENKAPMCGVPYHSASAYISKLTKAGRKVAICEQISDPSMPGIVERDVVRVITPGTTLDEKILNTKTNNYIASIVNDGKKYGIAFSDVTTGEFRVFESENLEEFERIGVIECIFEPGHQIELPDEIYKYEFTSFKDPEQLLKDHFNVGSLDGFGIDGLMVKAAGRLLHYLMDTQKTDLTHISSLKLHAAEDFMPSDEASLKNLEIFGKDGSLISVLDKTLTAMGGRMLRKWILRPLLHLDKIQARLDAVRELTKNQSVHLDLCENLKGIHDIERILGRLSLNNGNARDLLALKHSFRKIPEINKLTTNLNSKLLKEKLDDISDLVELIETAICDEPPITLREGGIIKDGYNEELDKLKNISRKGKNFIKELQIKESQRTGIGSLKVKYNKVFGYYIEISNANLANVPEDYMRKQTLVNAERFITPELKEYEETVLNAEEKIYAIEYNLFDDIRRGVVDETARIQKVASSLARIDTLCCFAKNALHGNYCEPVMADDGVLHIVDGRHPVVECLNFSRDFIPNDTRLSDNEQFLLITGPNMAGKSCYLRQVALITLMAHIGSFVPATEARICLVDRIFTRIGASDNLVRGQSTFMVEMQESAYILHNATAKSLIILDEIGRGTSTYDGMSIAWAILEYIHNVIRAKTLFATHYHELIPVAERLERARNVSFAVRENEREGVVFLYKLLDGGVDKSYGVEVGKLAGLPASVTSNAARILCDLEEGLLETEIKKKLSKEVVPEQQLGLFCERRHVAISELQKLDVNNMTPIEALNKLNELKLSAE